MPSYLIVFHWKGTLTLKTSLGILQRLLLIACCGLPLHAGWAGSAALQNVPDPIGYVSDYARVLEPAAERKLATISSELERKTGVRIRVLTLPNLGSTDLESVASELLAAWSETPEIANHSILIIDAIQEKLMRIEMGSAIPRMISEEVSQRVQQQVVLPNLIRGDRSSAYLLAVLELSTTIGLKEQVALYTVPGFLRLQPAVHEPLRRSSSSSRELLLFVPLLIFMVGMARLENKMARATVIFGDVFRARMRRRFEQLRWRR